MFYIEYKYILLKLSSIKKFQKKHFYHRFDIMYSFLQKSYCFSIIRYTIFLFRISSVNKIKSAGNLRIWSHLLKISLMENNENMCSENILALANRCLTNGYNLLKLNILLPSKQFGESLPLLISLSGKNRLQI